ncbi:Terpene synthase, partial [Thalictrum thalictroides]
MRLCNDLASSSAGLDRDDGPSAIQCYMKEANTSEQDARDKIRSLIFEMWKKINESIYDSPFEQSFVDIAMNHARTAHSIYRLGDGMSFQDLETS